MTHNTTECQQRLIDLKFLPPLKADGKSAADGTFGTDSLAAFNRFLAQKGKPPIGPKEWTLTQISAALFPEDAPPPPAPKPPSIFSTLSVVLSILQVLKGRPMDTSASNWFSSLVASTAGQYVIAMVATWIANKLGLDPTTGHVTVEGVIVQLLGVIPMILGIREAAKSKVVVNGTKVSLKSMPVADQQTVAQIAAKNS